MSGNLSIYQNLILSKAARVMGPLVNRKRGDRVICSPERDGIRLHLYLKSEGQHFIARCWFSPLTTPSEIEDRCLELMESFEATLCSAP